MSNFKEHFINFFKSNDPVVDSFVAGGTMAAFTQFFEGVFRILGWVLTAVLVARGIYGIYKDSLDVKGRKLENELKLKQLKKLEEDGKVHIILEKDAS
jgi:hypothetical protein